MGHGQIHQVVSTTIFRHRRVAKSEETNPLALEDFPPHEVMVMVV